MRTNLKIRVDSFVFKGLENKYVDSNYFSYLHSVYFGREAYFCVYKVQGLIVVVYIKRKINYIKIDVNFCVA